MIILLELANSSPWTLGAPMKGFHLFPSSNFINPAKSFDHLSTPWMNLCVQKLHYCEFLLTTVARNIEHPNLIGNACQNREWEERTQSSPNRNLESKGKRKKKVAWPWPLENYISQQHNFFLCWLERHSQVFHSEVYLSLQVPKCIYLKFNSNFNIPKTELGDPSIAVLQAT